jgi:uncharacterized membrane protein
MTERRAGRPGTEAAGKGAAQQRADRLRVFHEELLALEREGVVTLDPAQHAAIELHVERTLASLAERFDVDTTSSQKRISWGMRIVSTLGGLALCASVVLFFHRYWGYLGTAAQVGVVVVTPLVLLAATDFAARRERTRYYASLLSIVTFAAFVLNLSVLGGTFNLTPSPTALLAWGVFALLLAYTYRLRLPLAAGLTCVTGFLAASFSAWWGGHWLSFPERPEHFLVSGLVLIGAPLIPVHARYAEFHSLIRGFGVVTLFLALLILSEAGTTSYLPVRAGAVEILYQVAGFTTAALAIWLGVRARQTDVAYLGAAFFTVLLNLRFFHWWWDWMPGYLFFLVIGLIAVGLLFLFQRLRARMAEGSSL